MKTVDDAFSAGDLDMLSGIIEEQAAKEAPRPSAPKPQPAPQPQPGPEKPAAPEMRTVEVPVAPKTVVRELTDDGEGEYSSAGAEGRPPREGRNPGNEEKKSLGERLLSPLVSLMALVTVRREQRVKEERPASAGPEARSFPEMDPSLALKFYGAQMRSLRLRAQAATGLCLVLIYLTLAYSTALPLLGALSSVRVLSLLLLILELSVVMAGLDVFTSGLLSIPRGQMGGETLAALSCVFTMLDAVVTAAVRKPGWGIPYCAVSAVTLTFALWGNYYSCKGYHTSFRILISSAKPYILTVEDEVGGQGGALMKLRRRPERFITRSEEADLGETVYGTVTPFLILASLLLGLLSSLARGQAGAVVHCIAGILGAAACFPCAACFSIPFAAAARHLAGFNTALAGWPGLRDIGKSGRVVITDADVFPSGTVEVAVIRIRENADAEKIIAYTGSIMAASGNALASTFTNLLRRNSYVLRKVEDFQPRDGGGMTGIIAGESVSVGCSGYMNLMGIRIEPHLTAQNTVYTAIGGEIVGIFEINYKPMESVRNSLLLLLQSKLEPVFAVRDFNVSPSMLKSKFRLPSDAMRFPAYTERYRISAAAAKNKRGAAAVLSSDAMSSLVAAANAGNKAYTGVLICVGAAVAASVFGMILMFILCWTGYFASAANLLLHMFIWLVPEILTVVWLLKR